MNHSTEWQVYCPSTLLTSETEHHYAEDLVEHYEASLVNNEDAMCFLTNVLALAHQDVVSHFRIGFSDRTFPRKISLLEPPESEMARGVYQRLGLFKPNGHETFRGMIFVPEFDANHDFIGAFGQRIAPFPLKKRSATAYAVRAGVRGLFFNHQVLGTFDRIILCESPFDVISLHIVSVHNAVALLDYRYFDNAHLSELLDNGVTHVTCVFRRTRSVILDNPITSIPATRS